LCAFAVGSKIHIVFVLIERSFVLMHAILLSWLLASQPARLVSVGIVEGVVPRVPLEVRVPDAVGLGKDQANIPGLFVDAELELPDQLRPPGGVDGPVLLPVEPVDLGDGPLAVVPWSPSDVPDAHVVGRVIDRRRGRMVGDIEGALDGGLGVLGYEHRVQLRPYPDVLEQLREDHGVGIEDVGEDDGGPDGTLRAVPCLFQQSLGFVDKDGNGIRYRDYYDNDYPPPPLNRGRGAGAGAGAGGGGTVPEAGAR